MSGAQKVALIGAGLVGLYLLSGRAGAGSGGFGGGGGADREPGDTIITFPELDLSNLWSDTRLADTDFIPAPSLSKKDMTQGELDIWATKQPWYEAALPGGGGIGNWFRTQPESAKIRSNILNPQPTPASIYDAPKKASYTHHGVSALPDPVSLGLTPKASYSGSGITTHHGSYTSPTRIIKKQTASPARNYGYGISQYGGY